jgi:hypothetical protein
LRTPIAIAVGALAFATTTPVAADYASREYDRGYHDCLAGRYGPEDNVRAYRKGCRAAERVRVSGSVGADRPRNRRSEQVAPVGIPKVAGMEPVQALTAMQSRGYRNVGTSTAGGTIVGIYFNPVTRECVQLASANNRVVDARQIGSDRRCR